MHKSNAVVYALIYVDDIIFTGSSPSLINEIITHLDTTFALKRLGPLNYFLGIEVKRTATGGLFMTQQKYIRDLLDKAKMQGCNPLPTPMVSTSRLSKDQGIPFQDPTHYRSIVGALQYLTITRPDISFPVNKVCQFMASPLDTHWGAVKRILRYLHGTISYGLHMKPALNYPLQLRGFTDADWATDADDRRSVSGAALYLGPNLISWWSKKQQVVARSSTEAEYRSLAHLTAEILWVQSLLQELKVSASTPQLYCDNQSTVALAHNPVLQART